MRELSLFTGAGGGLLGTHGILGWRCRGYVEFNEYCQRVIRQRIDEGILDEAPIFTDVREFVESGAAGQYRGHIDVVTGGFPCQPFSVAGKGRAADDERNMWPATIAVVREVRPRFVFLENVPGLLTGSHGYFGTVLGDLAEAGYDARWIVLGADDVGAPHRRKRFWIMAHAVQSRPEERGQYKTDEKTRRGRQDLSGTSSDDDRGIVDAESDETMADAAGEGVGELSIQQGRQDEAVPDLDGSGATVEHSAVAGFPVGRQAGFEAGETKSGTGVESRSKRSGVDVSDTVESGLEGFAGDGGGGCEPGWDGSESDRPTGAAGVFGQCGWWDIDPADMAYTSSTTAAGWCSGFSGGERSPQEDEKRGPSRDVDGAVKPELGCVVDELAYWLDGFIKECGG